MGLFKRGSDFRLRWHAALALFCAALAIAGAGAPAVADASAPRIVGGSETTTEEWPWQVALTRDGFFACGGSLIAADIVLTAAHCVQDASGTPTPAAALRAVFDLTDLSDENDPDAVAVGVQRTSVAEEFHPDRLAAGFDFALLLLATPLARETIDLATAADARRFEPRHPAWTTGWGLIDGNPVTSSSVLNEAHVALVDCSSLGFSDRLFFCARGKENVCLGDSGGPLMIRAEAGAFRQIGITSFADLHCEHFSAWTNVASGPVQRAVHEAIQDLREGGTSPQGSTAGADTSAPQTRITRAPKARIKTRRKRVRVTIGFTASEPSSFTCSLDGKLPRECSSPDSFRVKRGFHRFQVFATDASGNADPIPDTVAWRVKRIS